MENVSFVGITVKYVTKLTDKLICLNTFISKFTSFNGLKYHKIRYKSRENNPIKPFQFQFMCLRPVFLQVTCPGFCKCTSSTERSPRGVSDQRRRELFYCAIALWRDEMNDEKHEEIRRGNSALIKHNPKVFQPLLFYSISVKEHVMKKSKTTGPWTYLFPCPSLLKQPICTFSTSQKKWFIFKLIMITDSCSSITTKRQRNFFKNKHSTQQQILSTCFIFSDRYRLRPHRLHQGV